MDRIRRNSEQLSRALYSRRVDDRLVAELLGMCRGFIADGIFNDAEAGALAAWLGEHPDVARDFPGRELSGRLNAALADGVIDEQERGELTAMMRDLLDGAPPRETAGLPIDEPEPSIDFADREFVFTGHFALRRRDCARQVVVRGGTTADDVRSSTRYLIVGTVASEAWTRGTWGTKVLQAVDLKRSGHEIAIVSEVHWLSALQ